MVLLRRKRTASRAGPGAVSSRLKHSHNCYKLKELPPPFVCRTAYGSDISDAIPPGLGDNAWKTGPSGTSGNFPGEVLEFLMPVAPGNRYFLPAKGYKSLGELAYL